MAHITYLALGFLILVSLVLLVWWVFKGIKKEYLHNLQVRNRKIAITIATLRTIMYLICFNISRIFPNNKMWLDILYLIIIILVFSVISIIIETSYDNRKKPTRDFEKDSQQHLM